MEAVFLHIVNIAITASWLVLAVFLLRLALKKAPRWATCLLWGIVALRLILPFSLESALSLIPSSEPIFEQSVVTEAPSAQPILPEENLGSQPSVNEPPSASGNQTVTPPSSGSLSPTPQASADPMQIVLFAASLVWLCGVLAMLGYGAYSYLRLHRKLRASIRKEGRVYLCDNVETPFILGVFRPRIYLPSGIGEGEIPYVIAHEEAHLKRKDHLWKPLGFLLLSVYWFNPLFWVAYILLCRDIENACDEKVIKNCDNAYRVGYSEALLSCSIHRRSVMACPVAFGETGVKSRIRAVLHYKKPAFWVILVAIVAIIVTCVCFLTDPVRDKDETTTEVTTEDVPVTTGKTPAINLPSDTYAFYEPTPTIHSGVYENGNRWFLATVTGVTSESVLVKPHEECDESKLYTSENPLILPKSLYKNAFQDESQVAYLQIGDEIRVRYQGEIGTAKFVSFGWLHFGMIHSITTADLNQDGVEEEYIDAWGFTSGVYSGRFVIRDPAGQKTLLYGISEKSPLFAVYDIVTDSDGRVILYGSVNSEKVALGEILYQKERDYFYIDMYNSPTPEDPDAWKEKVEWDAANTYPADAYDGETGKYNIQIFIQDVHNVGQTNAEKAFAERFDLFYNPDYDLWQILGFRFVVQASKEEIEMYAKLDEVKAIWFNPKAHNDPITPGESMWWQQIESMQGITRVTKADGSTRSRFTLIVKRESGLFPILSDGRSALKDVDFANARVLIKDMNHDNNYTEYKVESWYFYNNYEFHFEVEGFVAEENIKYDMYLVFTLPEGTPYPGETAYIWALGEPWTLVPLPTTPTTTTPTTPEDPDAWKEKVVWGYDEDYPMDAYDEETGKYTIAIFVQDVHNIGQKEAEAAFAKKYSLDYDPENSLWEILDLRFRVYVTKDEIEMYARLEEVKQIRFVYRGYNE